MSRQLENAAGFGPRGAMGRAAGLLLAIAAGFATGAAAAQGPSTPPEPGTVVSQPIGVAPAAPVVQPAAPGIAVRPRRSRRATPRRRRRAFRCSSPTCRWSAFRGRRG